MRVRAHDCLEKTAVVLATGFGVGLIPVMPGTFGSLLGLPLAWMLTRGGQPAWVAIVAQAAIMLAGIPICGTAARRFRSADPGQVVYDEIAALPLVFLCRPLGFTTAILGFVWFRIFDIAKPWPVHQFERLPGGLGIMADDVAAALYAAAALWISVRILESLQS